MNQVNSKVVIIGAGISGLAAAARLCNAGFTDVSIFEARNRVGGRICSVYHDQILIDEGATFAHGVKGAAMQQLITDANETVIEWDYCDKVSAGKWLLDPSCKFLKLEETILNEVGKILAQTFATHNEFVDGKAVPISSDILSGYNNHLEYFHENMKIITGKTRARLEELNLNTVEIDWLVNYIIRFCKLREAVDSGSETLTDGPVWQFSVYFEPPGGDAVFKNGFSSIFNPLKTCIPASCIKLNHVVNEINWFNDEKAIGISPSTKPVKLTYAVNDHIETSFADHVIVTIPIGCLKRNHFELFKPALPQCKVTAIENAGVAQVEKIFLFYDEPFWNDGVETIILQWDTTSVSASDEWISEIPLFYVLKNQETQSHLLECWITGSGALLVSGMSLDEIGRKCAETFRRFFKDPTIPAPRSVYRSKWSRDPYSKGSYFYPTVHNKATDFEVLAKSLPAEKSQRPLQLLFAGEATITEHFSTVHGSYLTGEREAKKLIQHYHHSSSDAEGETSINAISH